MESTWVQNGFFDVEMIEEDGSHTVKVYLRGLDNTKALMAEAMFRNKGIAFQNAMGKALDQLEVLGRKARDARSIPLSPA